MTKHLYCHAAVPDGPFVPRQDVVSRSGLHRAAAGTALADRSPTVPSRAAAQTLSELERTLLILAGAERGASPDLLIIDDTGAYATRLRSVDRETIRARRERGDLPGLAEQMRPSIVRIDEADDDPPRTWPHADRPRLADLSQSTLFIPVGDQVDSLLERLWTAIGEAAPVCDDAGRLLGRPAQLIAAGALRPDRAVPLATIEADARARLHGELAATAAGIRHMADAMGLDGPPLSGFDLASLPGAVGFRMEDGPQGLDAIGLDGHFEPLVPPYVGDMEEAAWRFAERRHDHPRSPSDAGGAREHLVAYLGSVAQDAHDRFGRFPATVPTLVLAAGAAVRRPAPQRHHRRPTARLAGPMRGEAVR
ncbi:hypothetical protein [Chelatococcus reniformis]|uniref:Uncharacterized protein n=1 Tax=Chelatococcus reniformis TaxID=1494448 RepID=A0A916UUY6_9HYPH|nr:hypothetical protein [Chelatococcus reniformis]GGC89736.1 hypothetical protein GCM10010994_54480 [Chelatococcus reniformis]